MTRRSIHGTAVGIGILALGLLFAGAAYAQEIRLQKAVVADGGGTVTNGTITMSYTVGQPVAGVATNGTMNGAFGFWTQVGRVSGVDDPTEMGGVTLAGITPNPVTDGEGTVALQIARAGETEVALYNTLGQKVMTLYRGIAEVGAVAIDFSTSNLAAGVYYIAVSVPGGILQQSISVIK